MTEYLPRHPYEFWRWWYGPPAQPPNVRSIPGVPRPLREWYAAEEAWGRRLATQNEIMRASELVAHEGFTPFYAENQGVWLWAFRTGGDDPEVFDRVSQPAMEGWSVTGATLSEFLAHVAILEATITAPIGAMAIDIDRARYDSVVEPLRPVSMTPWSWPGPTTQLFVGDHVLAFGCVNDRPGTPVTPESRFRVRVAARSSDDLAYLDELDIKWTWNTRL